MQNSGNEQPQMQAPNCTELIARLPFWTRLVFLGLSLSWLVSLFSDIPEKLIASSVNTTFGSYRFWTVFTASIYVDNLLFLFIVIYNLDSFLPSLEHRVSTPLLMVKFIVNGAIIQILTLILQYLLFDPASVLPTNGVGGIWLALVFKYCHYNSDSQIKFCCLNWKFKKSVYPYVLLGVSIVLSWRVPLEMVIGLLYGLLQVNAERWSTFPGDWLAKIARLIRVQSLECWIRNGQNGDLPDQSDRTAFENLDSFQTNTLVPRNSPENTTVHDPFANKQGIRLGDY